MTTAIWLTNVSMSGRFSDPLECHVVALACGKKEHLLVSKALPIFWAPRYFCARLCSRLRRSLLLPSPVVAPYGAKTGM